MGKEIQDKYLVDKERFIVELQDIIKTWIKEKPGRTIASLARATNMADTTLRRLVKDNKKIVNEFIFVILTHIFDMKTFEDMVEVLENNNKPETTKWFHRHFSHLRKIPSILEDKGPSMLEPLSINLIAYPVPDHTIASDPNASLEDIRKYKELMTLYTQFITDVRAIFKAKPGNIPVILAGFEDILATQSYFRGGKKEDAH